jgi:hypothetical protein
MVIVFPEPSNVIYGEPAMKYPFVAPPVLVEMIKA